MRNLKADERMSIQLRELYQRYGYQPYRVSRFEEYDLYMQNKRFLPSEHVLAFSDLDGKLMALKPDVTLSIIKNSQDSGETLKVSYAENVYRVPRGAYGFREIMQTGLECIGHLDDYAMGEVLMLAAESLAAISDSWALDVADLGIVSGILSGESLTAGQTAQILQLISEKNLHGLRALCAGIGLGARTAQQLESLVTLFGPMEETLAAFEQMDLPETCAPALRSLRTLQGMMKRCGLERINLDFSVVNDMNYYNGLIFAGFIDGASQSVLSGGRYDRLMQRMGRRSEAIGFAVYLDQLPRLMDRRSEYDADVMMIYDADADAAQVMQTARRIAQGGESVRAVRRGETPVRCRRIMELSGEGKA